MEDMVRLFNGIEAKNLYWPSDMFSSVGIDYGYTETSEYLDKSKDQSSNFTGSYHSELTGNWGLALGLDSANPEVKLEQNGSEIEGSYGLKGGKIFGQVDGGTVNFRWVGSGSRSGTGKWTLKKGSSDIEGSWTAGHGIEMSGTWSLKGDPEGLGNDNEQANFANTPPPEFDLSGIYTSKVIRKNNNDYWCFNQKRTFQIKLKQDGNRVLGAFLSGITGEIKGTIVNNKVTFNWYTTRCSGGSEGQWTVESGGSNLQGFDNSEIVWEAQKNN